MATEYERDPAGDELTLESPDMVNFVTRYSDIIRLHLESRPYVRIGKILEGGAAIVYIPREMVEITLQEIGLSSITMFPVIMGLMAQADLTASGITQVQRQPYLDLRGRGVLLGFVDTGIDYTNQAFLYEDGTTKIKSIWDQTITGKPPDTYGIGTQYTEDEINRALRSADPYSVVPHRDQVEHGTFLAALAGSRETGTYMGAAPDSEIIMVKLRKANAYHLERRMIPPEQENAFSSADLMLGVQYIIDQARVLGRPVAICIGLGSNDAGHDGMNVMEEYLIRVATGTGHAVCVAAGNEAIARHHTQGVLSETGEISEIGIQTQGQGEGINVLLWNDAVDRFSVSLMSPAGELVERVPARIGMSQIVEMKVDDSQVSVEYFFPYPKSRSQLTWIRIRSATPGIWRIIVHGDIVLAGTYHAWLPITGFVDPGIEFLHPSPNFTITVPGTALGVLTVGAFQTGTKGLYARSSWGPTRFPALAPDLTAPGVNVAGIFPQGPGAMSSTCVSAAITAGACALMLQWGIVEGNDRVLNTQLIRSYLIRGCDRDPGIRYPNEQWGYGRLNLLNAFIQLREVEP